MGAGFAIGKAKHSHRAQYHKPCGGANLSSGRFAPG